MLPYLCQSVVLAVAASWMGWLWTRRGAGLIAAFGALYLAFPAVALLLQALGVTEADAAPAQWSSVAVTATLTVSMVVATRHEQSPVVAALQLAERDRQAAELRGRAHALAEIALAGGGRGD